MSILKQITILIIQIFFCTVCFAQGEKVDSLKKVLPSLRDSARVDCLNTLSGCYIKFIRDTLGYCGMPLCETNTLLGFSSEVSHYAALANEEALNINYIHGIAESLSYKAEIENLSDNFLPEERLCREALDWYRKSLNKKRLAETYFLLGHALYAQSFFTESIKNFDTAYEWHKKNGNIAGMYWTLTVFGAVYHESGDYEKTFEFARRCLDIATQNNNDWFRKESLTGIASLFQNVEDYKTALEYYRLAGIDFKQYAFDFAQLFMRQHQYDSAKYYYSLVDTSDFVNNGEYYFQQKKYDKALPIFLRDLDYNQRMNDGNQTMYALTNVAKTYFVLRYNDSAFKYGTESLSIAKQAGAKQVIRDASEILSSIYDQWHQPDSAYFYYKLYTTMKDSVLNDHVKGKLAAYSFEQKMELLNKEKQIQQVQLQKQSLLRNILIGSIIILLLLAAIIFRNVRLKRKNEKLESERTKAELQQQATELEMQALRAQMNPHFIFNSLNSINRFILQNNRAEASAYLTKFSKLVRMILQNSQASLITLESELDALKLYLEMEALRFNYHFEYKISVPKNLDIEVLKIPPLIIQPYVENAIWHGLMHKEEKGQLDIEVTQENDYLYFKITDNGIGRKKAAELTSKSATKHKSVGLKITADRIAMMQNTNGAQSPVVINDLVNADGSAVGTEVIIKMPVIYD